VTVHAIHFSDSSETVEELARAAVERSRGDAAATVETRFVPVESGQNDRPTAVARRILEVADELDAAVLVVGYHQKGPVESFLSGNTADVLIEYGTFPVTVVQ
jgi:nucleotide-binding universal stress UspA family protein